MLKLPTPIQVVHRIHEWMEEKLQTYFKRDTECLNHNMWMISCMLIWSCCCWFLVFLVCPAFVRVACAPPDLTFLLIEPA